MVFDYIEGERAVAAWRVLCDAGLAAVYRPDMVVMVSDDPVGTLWLAQRVEIPDASAGLAKALLVYHGLEPSSRGGGTRPPEGNSRTAAPGRRIEGTGSDPREG
jgi:hypothetical protein